MNQHVDITRTLPLDASWDVLVVGGGPAGCAAATAAARQGARTLLLEATGVLGGMGTAGLVPWFCGYDDGETIISRGLAGHVREQLAEGMPEYKAASAANPLVAPPIDAELLKRIYDDMVTDAGATVRFHSQLCAVEHDPEQGVTAIVVADKTGLTAFAARTYIDCTGDGDLATWAGATVHKGDADGNLQAASHCFVLANVNEKVLAEGPRVHFYDPNSPIWKAVADPAYPLVTDLHSCNRKIGPGVFGFNAGHLYGVDNTDPASQAEALLTGRKMAGQYRAALAEYHPAFREAFLAASGSLMGIRETRRIQGDYLLSVEDYRAARSFPDGICRTAYGIDVHGARPLQRTLTPDIIPELKERNRRQVQKLPRGSSVAVPYRCLTPRGLRNVLVAGRCISTDRATNGTVRIMACCLNTGEAAGAAAAAAAATNGDVHAVNTEQLRATLAAAGAYLE